MESVTFPHKFNGRPGVSGLGFLWDVSCGRASTVSGSSRRRLCVGCYCLSVLWRLGMPRVSSCPS
eukprot:2222394-Pyramimonas_sp.AAC.1